ncbi:GumC family protein [Aliamphritea spongicola]|uniref:GumC family protein n=1 Tax=Aliamphritea spongicola TaxID=707589 RepID=UPI001FAE8F0C|nr:polysaccharide biosynthesis tyrosine autokinase [Aliamphritea spongicola]
MNNQFAAPVIEEETIDLRQYWRTIMQRKWSILSFALVVTLLTIMVVFSIKPTYRATTTLLIEAQQANVVSIEEVYGVDSSNNEYYLTQFEILKSRQLAEKVITELNLLNNPEFNPEPSFISSKVAELRESLGINQLLEDHLNIVQVELTDEELAAEHFQEVTDEFLKKLNVSPVRKTQLVKISFEAHDRLLSATIANAIADAYIDNDLEARLALTSKASEWLTVQLSGLRETLKASERRLQEYRDSQGIVGQDGGLDIANTELELVSDKLVDARRDRLALESVYRQVRAISKNNPSAFERIPAVLQHPLVQSLKGSVLVVELKKSELAKRYGAKHPKMQAAQSELDNARRSLNSQILAVVNGIESEYRAAVASEGSLKSAVNQTKSELQSINRKEYGLKELEQEVEANRQLYDTFFSRLNETNATGDLQSANARISDPAIAPRKPAKPKKALIVALAFIVSIMFGIMVAFLLQALNNTIMSAKDVEEKLHATLLGLLPLLPKRRKHAHPSYTQYLQEPQSAFAEAVRTIRTGVVLSALDNPHKTLCVTSSIPGEGKTSTSLSLAYSLGQMEKVLLIDADMRRPSIAKAMGIDGKAAGLSNLVAGTADVEECIHTIEDANIDVLTAGIIPPNPLELLSSQKFAKVIEQLEGRYDRIVIDTAPTQAVSDALMIGKIVGAMIYTVKADSTNQQLAKNGLKRLKEANAPVIGVVLNQLDVKKAEKYGYDYSGYYDSYGYTGGN